MKQICLVTLALILATSNVCAYDALSFETFTGNGDKQEVLLASTPQRRSSTRKKRTGGRRNSTATTKATSARSKDAGATVANAAETSAQVVINHVVKKGDTFESIAKEYGITVEQLKSDNPGVKKCKEGATLVVCKDVSVKDATKVKAKDKDKDKKENKEKKKDDFDKVIHKVDKHSSPQALFAQAHLVEVEIYEHEAILNSIPDDKEHKKERKKEEKEINKLHKTAVKCYDAIIKQEPSKEAYLARGTHQMGLEKHKQAISDFETVLTYKVDSQTRKFCQNSIESEKAKHEANAERRKGIITAITVGLIGAAAVAGTTAAIVDAAKHGTSGSSTTTIVTTSAATPAYYGGYYPTPAYSGGSGSSSSSSSGSSRRGKTESSGSSSGDNKIRRAPHHTNTSDYVYHEYRKMIADILIKHGINPDSNYPDQFKVLSKREIEDIKEYQQLMKEIRIRHNESIRFENYRNINYDRIEDLQVDY